MSYVFSVHAGTLYMNTLQYVLYDLYGSATEKAGVDFIRNIVKNSVVLT
jgi:hypothetical protein